MHTSVWSRHAKEIYVYISLVCHAKEIRAYISLVCYAKDLCKNKIFLIPTNPVLSINIFNIRTYIIP